MSTSRQCKTSLSDVDKPRLIESLKKLNNAEDIENVVNIDEVIRYFVVHNFVLNFDSGYFADMTALLFQRRRPVRHK